MKKKTILFLAMLILLSLTLIACAGTTSGETPSSEPTPVEETLSDEGDLAEEPNEPTAPAEEDAAAQPAPAETPSAQDGAEPPEHSEVLSIVGTWLYVKTEIDGEQHAVPEFEQSAPQAEILEDGTIVGRFWTTRIEGTLLETSLHEYKIMVSFAGDEGGQFEIEDGSAFLAYNPTSGLLRWTSLHASPYSRFDRQDIFFVRA